MKIMTRSEAATMAIRLLGGPSKVARLFRITPWAANKWQSRGIPLQRVRRVVQALEEAGYDRPTVEDLVPELFSAEDGLVERHYGPRDKPRQAAQGETFRG